MTASEQSQSYYSVCLRLWGFLLLRIFMLSCDKVGKKVMRWIRKKSCFSGCLVPCIYDIHRGKIFYSAVYYRRWNAIHGVASVARRNSYISYHACAINLVIVHSRLECKHFDIFSFKKSGLKSRSLQNISRHFISPEITVINQLWMQLKKT